MQRGLTKTIVGAFVLGFALFGISSVIRENQAPSFIILTEELLWLESSDQHTYQDIESAREYLSDHDLKPKAIYFEPAQVSAIISTLHLEHNVRERVLSNPGILFDCRN